MKFKDIVSISGVQGLYTVVKQRKDGILARNISDQKISFISARNHGLSPLAGITIYTLDVDAADLGEVFMKMQQFEEEQNIAVPLPASDDTTLRSYMSQVLPNYDPKRVYTSDIKRIIKWYTILKNANAIPAEMELEETQDQTNDDQQEAVSEKE